MSIQIFARVVIFLSFFAFYLFYVFRKKADTLDKILFAFSLAIMAYTAYKSIFNY